MTDLFALTGKVALVTGANGGIGLGIAEGLASAGACLVIAGRNAEKNARAESYLRGLGHDAIALAADVATEEGAQLAVDRGITTYGRLDILVNNAGSFHFGKASELSLQSWTSQVDANLTCAFLCARAAYPHMIATGQGKIINVSSLAAVRGVPYGAAYCAAKGGVVQLTQALAVEWGPDNIQVNAILPGYTATELTAMVSPIDREPTSARTPARRWGGPQDFAGAAIFLASAASDFITGASLPVDGGYSAQLG